MPYPEDPLELRFKHHREKDHNNGKARQDREFPVLMMPHKVPAHRKKDGAEKPPDAADDKEFSGREMAEPQYIAKIILGSAWNEEKKEDEKCPFMMEKIVELFQD